MVRYWKNRLTRFELTRVLGARALQIAMGAPVLVKSESEVLALEIAQQELAEGKLPLVVMRTYPDGEKERLDVNDPKIRESIQKLM